MSDTNEILPSVFAPAARRLKLYMALQMLPKENGYVEKALEQWLQMVPLPGEWPAGEDAAFQTSLAASLHRTTWHAWGDSATFFPRLTSFLESTGAPTAAVGALREAVETLQPGRLGSWLELFDDTVDTGWFFPGELALAQALPLLGPSEALPALEQWASSHAIDHCLRVGQSIGEGNGYREVLLPLPGPTLGAELDAGLAAFEALGAPALPDEALDLLADSDREGMLLSLWLTEEGIAKAGLLLPNPDTILMLRLCELANPGQDEVLAAVEGTLDVEGPRYIECQHLADGFGVELHYMLKP